MKDTLPQREVEEIFATSIKPLLSGPAKEQPVAVFIGGQPGAGKSTLEAQLIEARGLRDAVRLDGDDLLLFHPRYRDHALENDRTAAVVCSDPRWWNMAVEHIREQRADVIISSPLAGPEWAMERFKDFQDAGYRVEAVFVAVDDAQSQLGIIDRYQRMREEQDYGRWVDDKWHDTAYGRVLDTADAIDRGSVTDAVHVGRRGGEIVHSNERTPEGGWSRSVPTREVIETERARPWTDQEKTRFQDQVRSLAGRVPEELRPLLTSTAERGQARSGTATATGTATDPTPGRPALSGPAAGGPVPTGLAAAAASRSGSRASQGESAPAATSTWATTSTPSSPTVSRAASASSNRGTPGPTGPAGPAGPTPQPQPPRPVSSGASPRGR